MTGAGADSPLDAGLHLLLGGARSGKSSRALALAEAAHRARGLDPVYLATAEAHDDEMRERIARHRAERVGAWRTVEAPLDLPEAVARAAGADTVLLVDCLTLWATNLMLADRDAEAATEALIAACDAARRDAAGPVLVVSNEVGLGIVPDNALARRFRDVAGRMNQRLAAAADRVEFVAAGLPLRLKG
ncbi:MAG: bifunctional adenosylcobinamide kinase/adenosylcobinamide-phosphate guanylyltransferase [Alphaproteobacteria bacterium]|nr:bifunctional adenosylcobinamide kinase/adenosylcobinamide-phosphate guanylyltransferase [Alphaproteobacteria bacterium]